MVFELKLADIGEGVHEAEIVQWHVKEGDMVKEDQVLIEVNTEKVATEITSPVNGKIISLEKKEGEIVKVGEILVKIDTSESKTKEDKIKQKEIKEESKIEEDPSLFKPSIPFERAKKVEQSSSTTAYNKIVLAAPAVRKRAREAGIDLHKVQGSGPAGRITNEDLKKNLTKQTVTKPSLVKKREQEQIEDEIVPLRGVRRVVAQTMHKSKNTAAHYTVLDELDMSALDRLREAGKEIASQNEINLTYLAFIIKALIPVLKEFPMLNASLNDEKEEIVIKHYYNIGIAVDTNEGLVVPVIKNAETKSIWEIAEEITILAEKARNGKLSLEDVSGGTFSVTSVGNIAGTIATPIIKWPEVAILGIMRGKMRPVAIKQIDGNYTVEVRKMMNIALSLDHRVVDGAIAARFIKKLIAYLENPELLWFEQHRW